MSAPTEEINGFLPDPEPFSAPQAVLSPYAEAVIVARALDDYPKAGPDVEAVRQKARHVAVELSVPATFPNTDTDDLEYAVQVGMRQADRLAKSAIRIAERDSVQPGDTSYPTIDGRLLSQNELQMAAEAGLKLVAPLVDIDEVEATKANVQEAKASIPGGDVLAPFSDPAERKIVEKALLSEARRKPEANPSGLLTHQTNQPSDADKYFRDGAKVVLQEAFGRRLLSQKAQEVIGNYIQYAAIAGMMSVGAFVNLRRHK